MRRIGGGGEAEKEKSLTTSALGWRDHAA